jgi:hypothetical protein
MRNFRPYGDSHDRFSSRFRRGLRIVNPMKSPCLAVTTMQSLAPAMEGMIIVERIARSSRRLAFGHQPRPEQRRLLVEWQDAPGLRSFGACKPGIKGVALFAPWDARLVPHNSQVEDVLRMHRVC